MKKLFTFGLTLALSALISPALLAKSKDDDDKKKKDEKGAKTLKKEVALRSAVESSERARSSVSQARSILQRPTVIEQRDRQWTPSDSYSDRTRHDYRDSNHNDDRGWSSYQYYRAPSSAYRGWDRGRDYSWNNHSYHWYDGSWVIIRPNYAYTESRSYGNRSEVRDVQVLLARRGYDPGPIDGDMGSRTRRAIEHFQDDRGLAVTGRIDRSLLAALDRG